MQGQAPPLPDHPDLPRETAASLAFLEDCKELKKSAPSLLPQGFSGDPTPTQMLVVSRILKCTRFPSSFPLGFGVILRVLFQTRGWKGSESKGDSLAGPGPQAKPQLPCFAAA